LFGHERGSFTGAVAQKKGKFELAEHGTLFLNEIGEFPLPFQAKLLRVLEQGEIDRVGGARVIPIDVRLIAATNRNLEAEVAAGRFREDLYYRLNVVPVRTSPLRERREDIPVLVRHFIVKCAKEIGRVVRGVSSEAESILRNYTWPGNVRQLKNVIERAIVLSSTDVLDRKDLPDDVCKRAPSAAAMTLQSMDRASSEAKRQSLKNAFVHAEGDSKRAAAILGKHPKTVNRWLKAFDMTHLRNNHKAAKLGNHGG
jgi:transcriptional regulator with PAS, ATPase and Fis domain